MFVFTPITIVCSILTTLILLAASWQIFEKAGCPGWACLIPFYNLYQEFLFVFGNGWYFLWLFVPIVNVVVAVWLSLSLARAFGKSTGYGVGLLLLPWFFQVALGFGDAKYSGPQKFLF